MERIKSACVRCQRKETKNFNYATGYDHSSCYDYLVRDLGTNPQYDSRYDVEEGFILENGEFVDRMKAMQIAKEAGQLVDIYQDGDYPLLYSYMVNYRKR